MHHRWRSRTPVGGVDPGRFALAAAGRLVLDARLDRCLIAYDAALLDLAHSLGASEPVRPGTS
jgi:hypothetical protein